MSDLNVTFGGAELRVVLGEDTDAAKTAAQQAAAVLEQMLALIGDTPIEGSLSGRLLELEQRGIVGAGTLGEREAYTYRNGGVTPAVSPNDIWLRTEGGQIRPEVWHAIGDIGPDGAVVTVAGWKGHKTQADLDNMSLGKTGLLPIENVEALPNALDNIADLYKVRLGNFRARALSSATNPEVALSWTQYGVRPDSQSVSWNGFSVALPGDATEFHPQDWSAPRPLFILGNSLSDITDVTNRWSQVLAASLGVEITSVARYSSDVRQVYRAGLEPLMLSVEDDTLLVGGTNANVTAVNGVSTSDPDFIAYPQSFLNTGDPAVITGVSMTGYAIQNGETRHVTVSTANGASAAYKIKQDAGQPALALDGPILFTPDASFALAGSRVGIWRVQNDFYSGVPGFYGDHTNVNMFIDIAKIVGATQGGPAFILPVIPNASWPVEGSPVGPIGGVEYGFRGRTALAAANTRLETLYPNLYLRNADGDDLNDWLQSHGDGSANDNADIAAGYTPRSLRLSGDPLHLNAAGDALVAEFVEDALAVQTQPPAITSSTVFTLVASGTQPASFPQEPVSSTDSKVAGIEALSGIFEAITQEVYNMISAGITYVAQTVTLNSGQASGANPVLVANSARRGLILKAPKDCAIALHSGATEGTINLYAGVTEQLIGPECPRNALYVFGLATGDKLLIEEG